MPSSQTMEVPASRRGASLVSVDGRAYPLQSARIQAEASGGIAFSTLVQTYRNPYAEPLEVVYTMPLPADGAVVGYAIRLGERVIRGEVRSREEARTAYEKAMFEGRTAGLLEQERDDTFTQRLGSIPAGVSAEITIEVLHPTAFLLAAGEDGPQWEYRFPTVASVRYEGAPGRVADADKLDVDRAGSPGEIPTRIELALTTTDEAGTVVRRVEAMPLDRDLVVRWAAAGIEIGARLVEGPGLPGDDGRYGLLTITPPRAPEAEFARDLTILIDASGSMSGRPLEWAKDVAAGLLRGLGEEDRFEVIAFASRPNSLTGGIVPVTDRSLGAALGDLANLRAGGATEMADAMVEALRPLRAGSQHQVVLVSDGQIGFEDEIVARIVRDLPDGARLHTVGVGAAPNRTLTSRAARAGRGVESFVCGDGEVAGTIARLAAATARPVLTDLKIASASIKGIAPARPRDVLAGQPLVVAVELASEGGSIDVSGRLAGGEGRWTCRIDVPPLSARPVALTTLPFGALYGRETIADIEMAAGPAERVEAVALRHRIASRRTSLVAVADEPSVDPKAPRRKQVLAVEVPAFLSAEALGLEQALAGGFRTRGALMDSVSSSRAFHASLERSEQSILGRLGSRLMRSRGRALRARVLRVQDDLLVLELDSPEDGFLIPDGAAAAAILGRPIGPVSVDPAESSPRGPHAQGLLLRIAVRRPAGWPVGGAFTLAWESGVTLEFTLGDRA
jgi:Ca-activated chloride channel family protein